jgi:hypothetical protein
MMTDPRQALMRKQTGARALVVVLAARPCDGTVTYSSSPTTHVTEGTVTYSSTPATLLRLTHREIRADRQTDTRGPLRRGVWCGICM